MTRFDVQSVAMIPPDLLEIIVCPACRISLESRDNGARLHCSGCGRIYPVQDNIPILLLSEADAGK